MVRRGPVTETLQQGDDERPGRSADGLIARFVDWYAERPVRTLGPLSSAIATALLVVLVADTAVVVRHDPTRPSTSPSPSPSPSPASPEVVAERERVAFAVARFAATNLCDDRAHIDVQVAGHEPDWSDARFHVFVGVGTPPPGRIVVDVQPFDIGVSYHVVDAGGRCRRN